MLQKVKEKCRHDVSAHDLPVIPVGATAAYINNDLKTWSIGKVEKHENHSYAILTEEGRLVSHNQVHFCKTNVSFGMSSTSPNKSFVPKFDMPIKPLNMNNQAGQLTITPKPKAKQTPVFTPPKVELRTSQEDWLRNHQNLICSLKICNFMNTKVKIYKYKIR